MGFKADLKEARAKLQAGEPTEAVKMIQIILDSGSREIQDPQTMYAVLNTAGLANLAAEDFTASEGSFRKAAESLPDAPQAWKGLIDCLERAGNLEALPEALTRAAEIAESKGNYSRARSLRLRLGGVLDSLGKLDEALEALLKHLDDPDAMAIATEKESNPLERLSALLLAAVLQEAKEDAAVSRRVEKRILKDSGISDTTVGRGGRGRAALAFEYAGKALAKDDEEGGPVARRFSDAMCALEDEAGKGGLAIQDDAQSAACCCKLHVARFCHAFLRRAVQRAESLGGGDTCWQEAMAATSRITQSVGASGWDDGWAMTATLLVSSYQQTDTAELEKFAEAGVEDTLRPWLSAEACLHLARSALSTGDGLRADTLLKTAAEARGRQNITKDRWVELSGPGSDWRELSLRCLASECLGYPGGDRAAVSALGRIDAAIAAFEASCKARGMPVGGTDVLANLALARASQLLALGRLEEGRSAMEIVSSGVKHVNDSSASGSDTAAGSSQTADVSLPGELRPPCLHCRALCVASDMDIADGKFLEAENKLTEVLDADGGFANALSRLGWLLLGFAGGTAGVIRTKKGDPVAALPLLERAVKEEPGSSSQAFRLARCYWEVGGEHRTDRNYCFNVLLKAAKLNPSNAEAFEWLGYWYHGVGGDQDRARGCFLRALKLDPERQGAGEALTSLYLESGQETLAVGLLRQCAAVSVSCHWAWAGLGRTKILEGNLAEAAAHLQQAIRGYPTSWSYWSDLGWCYHAEGKQAAALKAYTRAAELLHQDEEDGLQDGTDTQGSHESRVRAEVELTARIRVQTQVGTIQRQVGQVDEAVSSFTQALELQPNSALALEGAGEAYLAQAHARTSEGLYTAAFDALQKGCVVTKRLLAEGDAGDNLQPSSAPGRQNRECGYKTLGDLYTYGHTLPPMAFEGGGARGKAGALGLDTAEAVAAQLAMAKEGSANRLAFVAHGAHAYQQLVELLEARVRMTAGVSNSAAEGDSGDVEGSVSADAMAELAPALYDLGLNYLVRVRLVCADSGEGSGLWSGDVYRDLPEAVELSRSAEQAFKQAIEADPTHSDTWNGLGAVSRNPLLQQHCWVRSVQLAHNPSAWANLGMLYVRWGMDHEAYESFGGLQAVTDHPSMWVGLGLLEEKQASQTGITPAKRRRLLSKASDAYYSSLETGQHVDGLLGLGTTAGRTHSQTDALVALQQHLDLNPNSAQAWNHLGAAAELAGRGTQAIAAYRRALSLLEEQGARFGGGGEGSSEEETCARWREAVRLARCNIGRALVLKGQAAEAVEFFNESDLSQADNSLQLGRAHVLRGDWDAAHAAIRQALAQGNGAVGVLISAAALLYHRGEKSSAAEAGASLMARYATHRRVLLTAVSLGALTADTDMTMRASRLLQTLPKPARASDPDGSMGRFLAEEGMFAAHLAMRTVGEAESLSRRALCAAVHLSPSSVRSWARLGAVVTDSAVDLPPTSIPATDDGTSQDYVSSELAESCVAVAESQAMFSVLSKSRDAGLAAAGASGAAGGGATAASPEVTAVELASSLSDQAKAMLCGGKPGSSAGAVKAAARAVHVYPGAVEAWQSLGAALVGQGLSSSLESKPMRNALGDALVIYHGVSNVTSGMEHQDDAVDMAALEAMYIGALRCDGQHAADIFSGASDLCRRVCGNDASASFMASLSAARAALCSGAPDVVDKYKEVVRMKPGVFLGWLELAACYSLLSQYHASMFALECGAQNADSGGQKRAASAAPLQVQTAATKLLTGHAEEGLASVSRAFRHGKGGAVGHVLRALISLRLDKENLATQAFGKAKEADPRIAAFVDALSTTQAGIVEHC